MLRIGLAALAGYDEPKTQRRTVLVANYSEFLPFTPDASVRRTVERRRNLIQRAYQSGIVSSAATSRVCLGRLARDGVLDPSPIRRRCVSLGSGRRSYRERRLYQPTNSAPTADRRLRSCTPWSVDLGDFLVHRATSARVRFAASMRPIAGFTRLSNTVSYSPAERSFSFAYSAMKRSRTAATVPSRSARLASRGFIPFSSICRRSALACSTAFRTGHDAVSPMV